MKPKNRDRKVLTVSVKSADEKNRIIEFLGSTPDLDRDEEIVTADGWLLENYLKNPVFLWGHNWGGLPLGKTVKLQPTDRGLVFSVQFASIEEMSSNPENPGEWAQFTDTVYRLYRGGYLKTVSVGFRTLKREGNKLIEKELFELSGCSIPANPNAMAINLSDAVSAGCITDQEKQMVVKSFAAPERETVTITVNCADAKSFAAMLEENGVEIEKIVNESENNKNDADAKALYRAILDDKAAGGSHAAPDGGDNFEKLLKSVDAVTQTLKEKAQ